MSLSVGGPGGGGGHVAAITPLSDAEKADNYKARVSPHSFSGKSHFDALSREQVTEAIQRVGSECIPALREALADGQFHGTSYNNPTEPVDYSAVVSPGPGCFFALLSHVSEKPLGAVMGLPDVSDPNRHSWITHLELGLNKEVGMTDLVTDLDAHLESLA